MAQILATINTAKTAITATTKQDYKTNPILYCDMFKIWLTKNMYFFSFPSFCFDFCFKYACNFCVFISYFVREGQKNKRNNKNVKANFLYIILT